ncbi:uncharacterized protein BDR25DRAFT_354194 [Lindgomyces ingoldianus]|uniref:Uncharacterized protein n=1 Tax=Lindgomyces ingoldianus TaxID=673940 RepID=A0ACB6QZR7_9PLEO|nr:uncharacterized protein BDR25DRAFT_354194 [Lindgomyces ingoldianus]KAF2471696.1 hypothetical protein BDR25DRAFT_354194 [Lindgomyces ingoldianus]
MFAVPNERRCGVEEINRKGCPKYDIGKWIVRSPQGSKEIRQRAALLGSLNLVPSTGPQSRIFEDVDRRAHLVKKFSCGSSFEFSPQPDLPDAILCLLARGRFCALSFLYCLGGFTELLVVSLAISSPHMESEVYCCGLIYGYLDRVLKDALSQCGLFAPVITFTFVPRKAETSPSLCCDGTAHFPTIHFVQSPSSFISKILRPK